MTNISFCGLKVCDERIGRLGNFFSAERTPNGDAKPRCVRTRRGSVARIVRRECGECQQRGQNEGSFHGRVRFDRLVGSLINAADGFPATHSAFLRRSFRSVRRPAAGSLSGFELCRPGGPEQTVRIRAGLGKRSGSHPLRLSFTLCADSGFHGRFPVDSPETSEED